MKVNDRIIITEYTERQLVQEYGTEDDDDDSDCDTITNVNSI